MNRAQVSRSEAGAGVEQMLAGRLERFGGLDENDAMAVFALILRDGEVTAAEAQDVITAVQRYEPAQPAFGTVIRALLQQLLAHAETPAAPAPPPATPREDLDPRVMGRWSYTSYYSAGTFSSTVNRVLILGADGRFAEDGSASANLRQVDTGGHWTGTTSAYSQGDPGERGRWKAQKGVLRLDYDNATYAEYRYETSGAPGDRRLLTRGGNGKQQFWVEF